MIKFNIIFIFIFLCFASTSTIQYPLFACFLAITILKITTSHKLRKPRILIFRCDYIPLVFLIAWIYGIVIGLIRSNQSDYVFANFAGMVMYLFYFFLIISNVSKAQVFKILYNAALFVLWLNLFIAMTWLTYGMEWYEDSILSLFFGEFRGGSSTGQMRLFNSNQIIIFVILSISLNRLFSRPADLTSEVNFLGPKTRMRAIAIIIFSLIALIGVGGSKGYMLSIIVMFLIYYLFSFNTNRLTFASIKRLILPILFFALLSLLLVQLGYSNIATEIFSEEDEGNIGRYYQLIYFFDDLTFFGKGLGSVVQGFIASSDKPYGYELSYFNVIHKFGLFAAPLFICYIYCIYIAVKGIGHKFTNHSFYSAAGLGAIAYLGPSLGNPIIFNPQMVILHCLMIFLTRPTLKP